MIALPTPPPPPPPPAQVQLQDLPAHPRLWLSADGRAGSPSVTVLKDRVKHPRAAAAWAGVQESSRPEARALVSLLTGDETARNDALAGFVPVRNALEVTSQALAYDWLYPDLSESQRRELAATVLDSAETMWGRDGGGRLTQFLDNNPARATSAICLAALAAADEFPDRAQALFDRGWEYQYEQARCTGDQEAELDPLNPIYPLAGGGWPEGYDYDRHGTLHLLTVWLALRSAGGPDLVTGSRFVDAKILWHLHGLLPSGDYLLPLADNDWPGGAPFWHDLLILSMSAAAEGPHAPYLRDYLDEVPSQAWSAVPAFLFVDPDAPRTDWRTLPTDYFAAGTGTATFRTDWTKEASYVAVHASDHFVYHQQNMDGTFYIYRNAPLAWRSGVYDGGVHDHNVNYLVRSIAGNCLLVTDPAEQYRGPNRVEALNEGGQVIGNWRSKPVSMETLAELRAQPESYIDRVTWLGYEAGDTECYAAFEYGRAYQVGKVPEAIRQLVFVKPDWVVVLDRVTAREASFQKTFLLHSPEEMTVDPEAGLTTITTRSGPATVKPGRLFCRTLLPLDAKLVRVGGEGQEFISAGANRPHRGGVNTQLPGTYRLEVQAPTGEPTTIFLHLFYLAPSAEVTEMPPAELVIEGNGWVQVRLRDGSYVLRFPITGEATWEQFHVTMARPDDCVR